MWAFVRAVSRGRVVTYRQVAEAAGSPKAAQSVGNAMAIALSNNTDVPWWRVVRTNASISPKAPDDQRERLKAEGVSFDERGRIDLDKFGWTP